MLPLTGADSAPKKDVNARLQAGAGRTGEQCGVSTLFLPKAQDLSQLGAFSARPP